jgi:predicted ribosome quality control (RQC) complex YloA/Tae2 family protein
MSLNWKEINLILDELALPGSQIQGATQSAFDILGLRVYKKGSALNKGATRQLLIALSPGACRMHETFRPLPKTDRPLRFAQFLNSRIVNGWIEEAAQLGDNRIVRLLIRRGENRYRLFIRLWSNAANCIVTDEDGNVLDAMRRLPKKNEVTGGVFIPDETQAGKTCEYEIREFAGPEKNANSFNEKIDAYYAEKGSALSLEALKEQARRACEGSMGRLQAALDRLQEKEAKFTSADHLRDYGDIILANIASINLGDAWLETDNFFDGNKIQIKLDPLKSPSAQAELYYGQYAKAKKGLADVRAEIEAGRREIFEIKKKLEALLAEGNPLVLAKLLRKRPAARPAAIARGKKRPGLSFKRGDWLIIVGRDASENDALLRRHVKGGDLWLHARDFPGSYVFIKQRSGKSYPLDILLDAGNLAIFYSKGRNSGEGDLFYTPVKYLRRAKDGPKGLVIPTQEKNLRIKLDEKRLKELESCRTGD